jgi:hypothetical protein
MSVREIAVYEHNGKAVGPAALASAPHTHYRDHALERVIVDCDQIRRKVLHD